jgi:CBS domain-containing protein
MKDSIGDLAPREPLVVAPSTPLGEVLWRMADRNVGCAIVVRDHQVAGIFTERDLLLRLNVDAAELIDRPVADFMTCPVETLELDDRIAFALHKMDLGGYRHVPVLSEGRVTGIISARHILRHISAAL